MNKEINHEYTEEVVCPHCGYEHGDSWERDPEHGKDTCDECGKEFVWNRDVEVTYSTSKVKE